MNDLHFQFIVTNLNMLLKQNIRVLIRFLQSFIMFEIVTYLIHPVVFTIEREVDNLILILAISLMVHFLKSVELMAFMPLL